MSAQVTPMMAQFLEIKAQHRDALLFYRMGDFYEMFFDDAVAAAEALDIALTKRGKHHGKDIPMCGVPAHSAEGYFLTLIRKGFRVAVCEQMENPAEAKKRGYKSVVRRAVVRLVTPGTLTEDSLLEARSHNFLAAYADVRGKGALAWADISTGVFHVMACPLVRLAPELARLDPREVLVADGLDTDALQVIEQCGAAVTPLSPASFDSRSAETRIQSLFQVKSLDAFGKFTRSDLSAMGAIIDYLEITQKGKLPLLRPPMAQVAQRMMQIDAATRRNLELTTALSGGRAGSLLATIDRTITSAGGRLLERRLSSPSTQVDVIAPRHEAIASFIDHDSLAEDLRDVLRRVPDMDRALSRLSLDRAGPRDLAAIRNGLSQASLIHTAMGKADLPPLLRDASDALVGHDELIDLLERALIAEPPLLARDGGFVASGYHADLDETRQLRDEGRGVIAGMQAEYAKVTGVQSLKIKHNNVLGYFIETTATHAQKMLSPPMSEQFIHRQTTASQVRFTTVDLSELETRILNAGNRALEIEKTLFQSLMQAVLSQHEAISAAAAALAEIDVSTSLATLARQENWVRPVINNSRDFVIIGGRHPVVERSLQKTGEPFITNDCTLSAEPDHAALILLTGPNMAGKSTFLRQNALIAILAQMGCYVPATGATIGLVSQVFSRVGASDDLAQGRSTFMVEMVETAAILNQADNRALVILDEIGRGTATYDGLSIAWATLEHLHDVNKCRALFATHYHEMTSLADRMAGVENATVAVREWEGDVIFLHEVRPGGADRSYGVQVAKLAGLPPVVVSRAQRVLEALEKGEREGGDRKKALIDDLPLFSVNPLPVAPPARPSKLTDRLKNIHPDTLSPRDALDLIYELIELSQD
jgi:DNA mismatch repair protein MutS